MTLRGFVALSLLSVALTSTTARADYDWYDDDEKESEPESREETRSERDSGDAAEPYEERDRGADGFNPGLRFAYGLPLGDAAKNGKLDEIVRGALKVQLDLDYLLNRYVSFGLYLGMGGGFLPKDTKQLCDMADELADADCSLLTVESGLQAAYFILPGKLVTPWLGANLGLGWQRFKGGVEDEQASVSMLGVAFGASVGADFQLGDAAFGPYFSAQFGRFMRSKVKLEGSTFEEDSNGEGKIDADVRAFHEWLHFGIRARYQF